MKFDIFLLPTVPGNDEDRERLRPIGRDRERLQAMYDEVIKVCQASEDAGIDVFSTTEHHFHSEGFEVSSSPIVLYSHLAAICTKISFAPLAVVLPSWDPVRLAEELATLDHLTRGRLYVGLARGYQPRWTQVLGQKFDVKGATMDGSEVDLFNREVFDEMLDIIVKAWTEDSFTHDGKHYKVPYPTTGIDNWIVSDLTRRLGAPGEIDDDGKVQRLSLTPGTYQKPHPPLWQAYAASESTILRCAERGIVPLIFISKPDLFNEWCVKYQDIAASQGRTLGLGEGVGAVRSITFGETYEEAFELGARTTGLVYQHYFGPFGFLEPFRRETDPPEFPLRLGGPREIFQREVEDGYALCGTPDQVKRQVESLARCHGDGALEWLSWNFFYQGLEPWDVQERQIEYFAKHIIPEFHG
jgi:alkanesulfonate monooxygenase SsuD/methylene tetrahydromethanopterin reductase-like flavin-dependent oxidoreductase (luciferase family)